MALVLSALFFLVGAGCYRSARKYKDNGVALGIIGSVAVCIGVYILILQYPV